jgi:hypothetical protein
MRLGQLLTDLTGAAAEQTVTGFRGVSGCSFKR